MAMIMTDDENHNCLHWQNSYNYTKTKVTIFFYFKMYLKISIYLRTYTLYMQLQDGYSVLL